MKEPSFQELSDGKARIALVNPPFSAVESPSIQLGLLKAICRRDRLDVDDHYVNVDFARSLGLIFYSTVCYAMSPQIGEWLFGAAAFGDDCPSDRYLNDFQTELRAFAATAQVSLGELAQLRAITIPSLVEEAAQKLATYEVVAFTSTFQQNVAALALAQAVKRRRPEVRVAMGGSNFHGSMGREYFRVFDYIDLVVTGEADHLIVDIFRALVGEGPMPNRPGVLHRAGPEITGPDPIYTKPMDDLPTPDYTSYFAALERNGMDKDRLTAPVSLPFESSRGCWWGAKHHCTFCGLNSVGMTFRAKTPERAAQEVAALIRDYGVNRLDATDNIVERKNMTALMEALGSQSAAANLFYEIKSNITAADVRLMRGAGVRRVQPGIESFSTNLLRIMNKGVSGLQNINALRWLYSYGVDPLWNILFGFPGEQIEDYTSQSQWIPLLTHLPPPQVMTRINLDRFSPNLERDDLRSLFRDVAPQTSYGYIYPQSVDLEKAAYHFEGIPIDAPPTSAYPGFFRALERWRALWKHNGLSPFSAWSESRPQLTYSPEGDEARIIDSRFSPGNPATMVLERRHKEMMDAFFWRPTSIPTTLDQMEAELGGASRSRTTFEDLKDLRLVVTEGDVALALPTTDPELCGDEPLPWHFVADGAAPSIATNVAG